VNEVAVTPGAGRMAVRQAPTVAGPSVGSQAGRVVAVPGVGLRFPGRLPFDTCLGVVRQLSAVVRSSAWCPGDWLANGQRAYGSRYREALERTGVDYQTLRNCAWVARRFTLSRRRGTLSFGHHAEVASLPDAEQDFWLRKAEKHCRPTSKLRQRACAGLRVRGGVLAAGPAGPARAGSVGPRDPQGMVWVHLSAEQARLWEQAAGQQGLALPAWAVQVLDRAARDLLHHQHTAGGTVMRCAGQPSPPARKRRPR
jgi:hypothetical protein